MPFEDAEIADEGEAENGEQGDHTEVLTLNSALSISFSCTNSVLFVLFMTRAKLLFHRFL
jgi:hypothetical protein